MVRMHKHAHTHTRMHENTQHTHTLALADTHSHTHTHTTHTHTHTQTTHLRGSTPMGVTLLNSSWRPVLKVASSIGIDSSCRRNVSPLMSSHVPSCWGGGVGDEGGAGRAGRGGLAGADWRRFAGAAGGASGPGGPPHRAAARRAGAVTMRDACRPGPAVAAAGARRRPNLPRAPRPKRRARGHARWAPLLAARPACRAHAHLGDGVGFVELDQPAVVGWVDLHEVDHQLQDLNRDSADSNCEGAGRGASRPRAPRRSRAAGRIRCATSARGRAGDHRWLSRAARGREARRELRASAGRF